MTDEQKMLGLIDSGEIPESMQNFINNVDMAKHRSIYLCQTFDKDGNLKDEKYGMNLLTNDGLNAIYRGRVMEWGSDSWGSVYSQLMIGQGQLEEGSTTEYKKHSVTDTGLFSQVGGGPSSRTHWDNMNNSRGENYGTGSNIRNSTAVSNLNTNVSTFGGPITYDANRRLMVVRFKIEQGMWDYNISGVSSTLTIREICIRCTGYNSAGSYGNINAFLASIYDAEGHESYIEKHVNERIYITAYVSYCVNVDVINTAYNNGIYLLLSPCMMSTCWRNNSSDSYNRLTYEWTPFFRKKTQGNMWWSYRDWASGYSMPWVPNQVVREADVTAALDANHKMIVNPNHWDWGVTLDQAPGTQYVSGFTLSTRFQVTNACADAVFATSLMQAFTFDGYDEADAEELTTFNAWTNNWSSEFFTELFGDYSYKANNSNNYQNRNNAMGSAGELPCTNFDITALKSYNHITHDWDIDMMPYTINGGRAMKYEEVWYRRCLQLYMNVAGSNRFIQVYVNPFTDYTITGFNNSGIVLRATDEYWDTSTYIEISDNTNLPVAAQHCRYYIIISGWVSGYGVTLNPIYADDFDTGESTGYKRHRFNLPNKFVNIGSTVGNLPAVTAQPGRSDPAAYPCDLMRPCSSTKNKWFSSMKYVVYIPDIQDPSTAVKHYLTPLDAQANGDINFTPCYRYCTDDRILVISADYYNNDAGRYVRIYDLTDLDTMSVTNVPYHDLTLPYHSQNYNTTIYPSISIVNDTEAYLVIQTVGTVANVVDIYNETSTQITGDVKGAFALNLSKYCAYQDTSESRITVKILDMSTMTVVDTLVCGDSDEGTYVLQGIFGWKNHLYVKYTYNDASLCMYYNITTQEPTKMDGWDAGPFKMYNTNHAKYGGVASVDECMVISDGNATGTWTYVIKDSNPTEYFSLLRAGIQQKTSYSPSAYYGAVYLVHPQLKYMDNGRRLILVGNGVPSDSYEYNYFRVIDVGLTIDDPDNRPNMWPVYRFPSSRDFEGKTSTGSCMILGDGVVFLRYTGGSSGSSIYWSPIDLVTAHKMTGTTTTINNYYNPISLSGKWFSFAYSNDMDTILGVTDEYQASLQSQEEDPET